MNNYSNVIDDTSNNTSDDTLDNKTFEKSINLILNKLDHLEYKIIGIENKLELITSELCKCEASCTTIKEHINFVDDTYQTLRNPLDFIRSRVNYLTGNCSNPLPQLKDKSNECESQLVD
jgi:DNA repair exonuclease SbcCD ATPase subunit